MKIVVFLIKSSCSYELYLQYIEELLVIVSSSIKGVPIGVAIEAWAWCKQRRIQRGGHRMRAGYGQEK